MFLVLFVRIGAGLIIGSPQKSFPTWPKFPVGLELESSNLVLLEYLNFSSIMFFINLLTCMLRHQKHNTVGDKLNDPTNKCTFDLRQKLNAL